ncbi:MAG: sigma 54-interacting transcriptional regulator [Deltaproteobacteria bacterium]|nr:sigma 54-interacting transcriptional regulator [Deltaproteobacteria bacterium]
MGKGARSALAPGSETGEMLRQLDLYQRIVDSIYNGVVVTDADGYILHFNEPYGQFLGIRAAAQIGRHITDVIENTRMHIVAQTGIPEINQSHRIRGQDMVVQRIPIKKDGRVIAVFGQVMFKNVRDVSKLAKKLSLLESKVRLYEEEILSLRSTRYTFDSIVGDSRAMELLKKTALKAAATSLPVLITGESGTGKEMFAQAIHHASPRRRQPFIRINCAAIPRDLLEAELFGYEKGAFTGAQASGKPGKFELAHRGTIFLDEIGELSPEMQPKLLRVLEEKEFERVGGIKLINSDFRLVAATNQDLKKRVADGYFRKDLYYRLGGIALSIPPLRERREDILPIARHLLAELGEEFGRGQVTLDADVVESLQQYDWPGNVREMANVLSRVLSLIAGDVITREDLPPHLSSRQERANNSFALQDAVNEVEKESICRALSAVNHNKTRAAELLGIHRTLLYRKMKKHGLPLS